MTQDDSPLDLWDQLLDQPIITLNLLIALRINPSVSAYSRIFVHYDFNRMPMKPPGTRVMVHEKIVFRACHHALLMLPGVDKGNIEREDSRHSGIMVSTMSVSRQHHPLTLQQLQLAISSQLCKIHSHSLPFQN